MNKRFTGKAAIITGAASGIGLAAAERFGAEGANVVLADLNYSGALEGVSAVRRAGAPGALAVRCDVSKEAEVIAASASCVSAFGSLDVVVNNAGLMIFKKIEEQTEEEWLKILHVDLLGAVFFTKQAFLRMKPGGAIVNVSSIHAVETQPLVSSYAAAKAALLSLTRSSALEAKPKGIRVNAVLPGAIDTPMLWNNPNVKAGLEHIERTDVGKPGELAAVIAFLASSDASFIQGASIIADGGRLGLL